MIGQRNSGQLSIVHPMRGYRMAACFVLLVALALQCFSLRAELVFRSTDQTSGPPPLRKYSNPSDVVYPRVPRGAAVIAEEVRAVLSGEITAADVASAEVMAGLLRSGRQKLVSNALWLASNGGDIDAAMKVGRLLRELGVFTIIGKDEQCMSACVFAFMGGERRLVAGRLGVHRPFFPLTQDFPDRPARFRHLQKTLRSYIEELDFPDSLYEAVMIVPPETMKILAPADLKRFYLEGISPLSEDLADAAAARRLGLPMWEYLQRKAKSPGCFFFVAGQSLCEGRTQATSSSGG